GAQRAGGERPLTNVHQLAALSQIEGDGDHFGAEPVGEPRNRDRRVQPAGIGKNDALHPRTLLVGHAPALTVTPMIVSSLRAKRAACCALLQMTRMVSSPAIVPTTSSIGDRSIATARGCAWPGLVFNTNNCSTASYRRR